MVAKNNVKNIRERSVQVIFRLFNNNHHATFWEPYFMVTKKQKQKQKKNLKRTFP